MTAKEKEGRRRGRDQTYLCEIERWDRFEREVVKRKEGREREKKNDGGGEGEKKY